MKLPHRNQLHRRPIGRIAVSWCAALLIASLPAAAMAQRPTASEHAVKAAIIFKIAKFVSWPKNSFAGRSDPLSICLKKEDPMAPAMSALAGKSIHGRVFSVRYLDDNSVTPNSCQILFLRDVRGERQLALLNAIAKQPILTISDTDYFTDQGGIIGLEIESNHVQFAINIAASESAGLDISAQLLQLAKITGNRGS